MFCHSLLSDWNHGNAHFLRGIVSELLSRGHDVAVYEPRDSWSLKNLVSFHGFAPINDFLSIYPWLNSKRYDLKDFDLEGALGRADLVLVHEWNDHELVRRIGELRKTGKFKLLFHDTHHRSVTKSSEMEAYDLSNYDGVIAFGEVITNLYKKRGWSERAWTWHEAADTRVFYPIDGVTREGDLVWIGNWGDDERTSELNEFINGPAKALGLRTRLHGVRYPEDALRALDETGIEYGGWIPNYSVPQVFAKFMFTVHVPRRPYVESLPGIPTIRIFEALACGIPLVCSPWEDSEGLFKTGEDFLMARDGAEMARRLRDLFHDEGMRRELSRKGLSTIRKRHTCGHRADELLGIYKEL